jgi:hypothetical protein
MVSEERKKGTGTCDETLEGPATVV